MNLLLARFRIWSSESSQDLASFSRGLVSPDARQRRDEFGAWAVLVLAELSERTRLHLRQG